MPNVYFTISKQSRSATTTNYGYRVFGDTFENYWLAVAVCVLLTYCNRVGFTVTRWNDLVATEETKVSLFVPEQTLRSISPEIFQQAAVLVGKYYERRG